MNKQEINKILNKIIIVEDGKVYAEYCYGYANYNTLERKLLEYERRTLIDMSTLEVKGYHHFNKQFYFVQSIRSDHVHVSIWDSQSKEEAEYILQAIKNIVINKLFKS